MSGYRCPICRSRKGRYGKTGIAACGECGAVFWYPFDKPAKGKGGHGAKCLNCEALTLHVVGTVTGSKDKVRVYRCSTCDAAAVGIAP